MAKTIIPESRRLGFVLGAGLCRKLCLGRSCEPRRIPGEALPRAFELIVVTTTGCPEDVLSEKF